MLSLLATKLYVKTGNERTPWFHNSEDICESPLKFGHQTQQLWVEKWIWSGFILTSVAVKYYRQLFYVAAFVIVFPILRASIPFFFLP